MDRVSGITDHLSGGTYLQAAASAADLQNLMISFFDGFRLDRGGLVHPQIRTSVWFSPAGGLFYRKALHVYKNHIILQDFQMMCMNMSIICYQIEEPSMKLASWTL